MCAIIIGMSELQQAVSDNVRLLILRRGLRSQRELARAVGVEYTNFNAKVRGGTSWTLNDIEKLAAYFRIEAVSLFGDGREFLDPNFNSTTSERRNALGSELAGLFTHQFTARVIPFPQVMSRGRELSRQATVISLSQHATHRSSLAVTA